VLDYHDISPTFAGVFGVNNRSACRRENRLATVRVAARIFVLVFAEMIVRAEILRVVPFVFFVFSLRYSFGFADWIREGLSDNFRGRSRADLRFICLRFGQIAGELRNKKNGDEENLVELFKV
jgi:hypothetical protein